MFSNLIGMTGRIMQQMLCSRSFHALPPSISNTIASTIPEQNSWSFNSVRTRIRNNFPRPNERKRLKVHGWRVMLSTKNGRRTIMRRILKGRYYLTH